MHTIYSLYTSLAHCKSCRRLWRTKGLSVAVQCALFVANLGFGAANFSLESTQSNWNSDFELKVDFDYEFDLQFAHAVLEVLSVDRTSQLTQFARSSRSAQNTRHQSTFDDPQRSTTGKLQNDKCVAAKVDWQLPCTACALRIFAILLSSQQITKACGLLM